MGDIKGMEPVAWRYRWKLDGEWVNWRVSSAGQRHPKLNNLEEVALYTADQVKELEDRLEKCADAESICDSYADENQRLYDRATTAEAALAEASKVIEPFAKASRIADEFWDDESGGQPPPPDCEEVSVFLIGSDVTVANMGQLRAARAWFEANKVEG